MFNVIKIHLISIPWDTGHSTSFHKSLPENKAYVKYYLVHAKAKQWIKERFLFAISKKISFEKCDYRRCINVGNYILVKCISLISFYLLEIFFMYSFMHKRNAALLGTSENLPKKKQSRFLA